MPKAKSKKGHTGPKPATRATQRSVAVDEPAVERVQLLDDGVDQDGKAPIPNTGHNVVDFEVFLKDSGLLDIQGSGGVDSLRSLVDRAHK